MAPALVLASTAGSHLGIDTRQAEYASCVAAIAFPTAASVDASGATVEVVGDGEADDEVEATVGSVDDADVLELDDTTVSELAVPVTGVPDDDPPLHAARPSAHIATATPPTRRATEIPLPAI